MEESSNPDCRYCNSFGFVYPVTDGHVDYTKVVPCSCQVETMEANRKQRLVDSCHFPPGAENMTIEGFNIYPEVKTAYTEAKAMADHPGQLSWLGLFGTNGNGKTHLAIAICKAWVEAGIPSRYVLVSLLLDELRQGFSKKDDYSYENKFHYYCNVPLLLLDDCGIQSSTNWVHEKLDTLIDYRLMNNLSLIVTSNQPLEEMPPRISSRLMRHPKGSIVAIMAEDYSLRRK